MGRNEALVCYLTAEEEKTALADINIFEGWIAELYRSTSKDKQNRVNEGYREEQNIAVERSQQKEREYKYQQIKCHLFNKRRKRELKERFKIHQGNTQNYFLSRMTS